MPSHSRTSSLFSNSDFQSTDGYTSNIFPGKDEQMEMVAEIIARLGFIPKDLVRNEVLWFYHNLAIDDIYFQIETPEIIANHIMNLYAAKVTAYVRGDNSFAINLEQVTEEGAVFIHSSVPGVSSLEGPQYERM